jgi:hypothetical protein|tara:strand:+ start:5995 stop:7122 length:1128 start_codon:yes stop_codon:yes gene_type:complete
MIRDYDIKDYDFRDFAGAAASALNTLRFEPDKGLNQALQTINQQRTVQRGKNKTIEYLKSLGTPMADRLANMVGTGVFAPNDAFKIMFDMEQDAKKKQDAFALAEFTNELAMKRDAAKPPKLSTYDKKYAALIGAGTPDDLAKGLASGRLITQQNPQTGLTIVFDTVSQTQYSLPDQVNSQVNQAATRFNEDEELLDEFKNLNIKTAMGLRGWFNNALNLVTDAVGAGNYFSPESSKVQSAMKVLELSTLALADTQFAGKPTNFVREQVKDKLTISPNEIFTGPDGALNKARDVIRELEKTLRNTDAIINSNQSTVDARRQASDAQPQVKNLLGSYKSLVKALENNSSTTSETFEVPDEDAALIQEILRSAGDID